MVIPEGSNIIPYQAFYHYSSGNVFSGELAGGYCCPGLRSVEFPSSLEYILYEAFRVCYGLSSLEFPPSLKNVSDDAFNMRGSFDTSSDTAGAPGLCQRRQDLNIGEGGDPASSLISVDIPLSTTVGPRAFDCNGCTRRPSGPFVAGSSFCNCDAGPFEEPCPTNHPTASPIPSPTTSPATSAPTTSPTTSAPTQNPTTSPTTSAPTTSPTTPSQDLSLTHHESSESKSTLIIVASIAGGVVFVAGVLWMVARLKRSGQPAQPQFNNPVANDRFDQTSDMPMQSYPPPGQQQQHSTA